MRGDSTNQGELLSYVSLEDRIPDNHPIRKVRKIVDTALAEIETSFDDMYIHTHARSSTECYGLVTSMSHTHAILNFKNKVF